MTYTFSSIEKGEYGKLYEFIKSKKVSVKTAGENLDDKIYSAVGIRKPD